MSKDTPYAAAPFDHKKADIILRSSDNVDFRVFKLFLSLASPSFEAMFQALQPVEEGGDAVIKDGLAVVRVRENSKTLDTLLRFCYPCTLADDPKLEVLKDLVDVLEAAQNYSLSIIKRKVLQALSNPKILEAEPYRCFAIARRGRAQEETLLAAKYTLALPLIPSWFQEINLITAADLLALLTYHQKCGDAVYALGSDLSWIKSHYTSPNGCPWLPESEKPNHGRYDQPFSMRAVKQDCECAKSTIPTFRPFKLQPFKWWDDFMVETFAALRERPCRATVNSFTAKAVQRVKAEGCRTCSATVAENLRDFGELMSQKVDEAVSKVQMGLMLF